MWMLHSCRHNHQGFPVSSILTDCDEEHPIIGILIAGHRGLHHTTIAVSLGNCVCLVDESTVVLQTGIPISPFQPTIDESIVIADIHRPLEITIIETLCTDVFNNRIGVYGVLGLDVISDINIEV